MDRPHAGDVRPGRVGMRPQRYERELAAVPDVERVIELFARWLYLPDPDVVLVVLAAVVANRLPGDPVWLLIVGPSGGGKTEVINAVGGLPDVSRVGVLTEAALLSGTPQKDTPK